MQQGSIIECIKGGPLYKENAPIFEKYGGTYPAEGSIYQVRGCIPEDDGIYLEEIINPIMNTTRGYMEPYFCITRFRELLPPLEIKLSDLLPEEITA